MMFEPRIQELLRHGLPDWSLVSKTAARKHSEGSFYYSIRARRHPYIGILTEDIWELYLQSWEEVVAKSKNAEDADEWHQPERMRDVFILSPKAEVLEALECPLCGPKSRHSPELQLGPAFHMYRFHGLSFSDSIEFWRDVSAIVQDEGIGFQDAWRKVVAEWTLKGVEVVNGEVDS